MSILKLYLHLSVLPSQVSRTDVISIDNGRQLLVDEYLIENVQGLERKLHKPVKFSGNPVFRAETEWEEGVKGNKCAAPRSGGIWWDPSDRVFKMWYGAGFNESIALATSKDGIHWVRPELDIVPGTNIVIPKERFWNDSPTVWLDHNAKDKRQRFKMFTRPPTKTALSTDPVYHGYALVSKDGIHWDNETVSSNCGDRSTFYFNPFANKWVFSLRNYWGKKKNERVRALRDSEDFLSGVKWAAVKKSETPWLSADSLDMPRYKDAVQLYNFDAVAYESLMIGFPMLLWGPSNGACLYKGTPKQSYLAYAYSRDGYNWDRRDRVPVIEPSDKDGAWDRGYVQSVGGLFTVVGDKIRIYYSGARGDRSRLEKNDYSNGMYYDIATGFAELRRDGFISYGTTGKDSGVLETKAVKFSGKYMFVNVDCPNGSLRVEVLDSSGNVLKGFEASNCITLSCDSTLTRVNWKGVRSLSSLSGRPVRFRFILENGELYSFWVSPSKRGESLGWTAAGGPGFDGALDNVGKKTMRHGKI